MDRTLKGEIYARVHRKALEHFIDPSNEEALNELTQEYFEDEHPDYLWAEQAHLEIASEGEADKNNTEGEERPEKEETENDNTPDEDVTE